MNENERVKIVRKSMRLNQHIFGKRLGVTGAAVSKIENGLRSLTDQMVLAICREFNINEEWLRNGTSEMTTKKSKDIKFMSYASRIALGDDDFIMDLVIKYVELPEEQKTMLRTFLTNWNV